MSSIKDFYHDQEVFITGATGFIGKALVEKVLRTCSGVKTVYLLMRPKKGQTPENRIKAMTENILFSRLKAEQPDAIDKLKTVAGDAKELRLGMSESDYEKVKSCSIIFHFAASVRFDDHLKDAILLNTRGAREVCELARKMPNLKVLVHVSTAYVQPLNLHVIEELIDVHCDWRDCIKMAENLPIDILDTVTMKLTKHAPNTYTFTKLLAEHICNDFRNDYHLPIVIYRPSIVAWSEQDPIPGWSELFMSYNGILASYHTGLKRVQGGDCELELIPVDLCVNGMIIASEKHQTQNEWTDVIPVYNAAATHVFNVSKMEESTPFLKDHFFDRAIGTPGQFIVPKNFLLVGFLCFFLQILPALLIDALLLLFKRKPMVLKLQRVVMHYEKSIKYFVYNEFIFDSQKYKNLGLQLCKEEKDDFPLLPRLSILQYFVNAVLVTKKALLNETDESESRARQKTPYYRALGWMIKFSLLYFAFKFVVHFDQVVRS